MKPILLKIKGLNSFIEEQKVDFTELTRCGFFGVFGKTGSGKSTILDAITLALYGKISRESNNFINANCEACQVSYEFQISSDKIHSYVVMREFRFDKKTQTPKAAKCKLMETTDGNEFILAESVREITDRCTEIIGLGIEDFMRTVVLPQGKFSEFLRLSGKPRRVMLERLFQLQKYGDELAQKMNASSRRLEDELILIEGELKGYEEVSEERLQELTKLEGIQSVELAAFLKEFEVQTKRQQAMLEVRTLVEELEQLQEREKELELQSTVMNQKKERLDVARKSVYIFPSICKEQETAKSLELERENKKRLELEIKISRENYKLAEEKEKAALQSKDEKLPKLEVLRNDIITAKGFVITANELSIKMKALQQDYKIKGDELQSLENDLLKKQQEEKELIEQINNSDAKQKELKIDPEYKKMIEDGKREAEDVTRFQEEEQQAKIQLEQLEVELKEITDQLEALRKQMNEIEEQKTVCDTAALQLVPPGTIEEVEALGVKENELRKKLQDYLEIKASDEEITNKLTQKQKEQTQYSSKKEAVDVEYHICLEQYKKQEVEELTKKLREELSEGAICPVCGSTTHNTHLFGEEVAFDDTVKGRKEELEGKLAILDADILRVKLEMNHLLEQHERNTAKLIQASGITEAMCEECREKKELLRKAITEYNEKKEALGKQREELSLTLLRKTGLILTLEERMAGIIKSQKEKQEKRSRNQRVIAEKNEQIQKYMKLTGITDFHLEATSLYKREKEREETDQQLVLLRKHKDELQLCIKQLDTKREEAKLLKLAYEKDFASAKSECTQLRERILSLTQGRSDVDSFEQETLLKVKEIEEAYRLALNHKDEAQSKLKVVEEAMTKSYTLVEQYEKSIKVYTKEIEGLLKKYQFENRSAVESAYLLPEEIQRLQEETEHFEKRKNEIAVKLSTITTKLSGRSVSENELNELNQLVEQMISEKDKKQEELYGLRELLGRMKESLKQRKELFCKREKLLHKKGIYQELEKLFRGNRFVEYVAIDRLKYISVAASKRLSEISNGMYELVTNDNGEFLIRDNKNGGKLRDCSSLSGGETFMTSLSLALALSSEIQLKGTAPLELFFLDEGFGSLDEDALEVVLCSLEKIHHDKLRIGVISHVEAIKNRVPIKLMVTAAQSGLGGSKVKIEYS